MATGRAQIDKVKRKLCANSTPRESLHLHTNSHCFVFIFYQINSGRPANLASVKALSSGLFFAIPVCVYIVRIPLSPAVRSGSLRTRSVLGAVPVTGPCTSMTGSKRLPCIQSTYLCLYYVRTRTYVHRLILARFTS